MERIKRLWEEVRELTEIPTLTSAPSPLSFLRRHVSQNQPCHVSNSVPHWASLSLWPHSDCHLINSLSLPLVSVHLTPSGKADALAPHPSGDGSMCFASGFVHKAPFGDVFGLIYESSRENGFVAYAQHQNDCFRGEYAALLDRHLINSLSLSLSSLPLVSVHLTPSGRADALAPHPNGDGSMCFDSGFVDKAPFGDVFGLIYKSSRENGFVAYAQHQNDCFRGEYAALLGDCESHIPWASEAFGCLPEAVNLWIGNECSETSFHKDHYENIYVVVTGEKHFLLLPPTDVHRMYIRDYPAANYSYCKDSGEFTLELEDPVRHVPWSSVDPYPLAKDREREMAKFPLYFNGPKPFEVTVKAGEMLYLPSMWFHHVRQSPDSRGRTIAVNYWYDMQFDIKYAYFNFLQSIPYPLSHDQASRKMRYLGSSLDTSVIDTEEKQDTPIVVDDKLIK